MSNVTSSTSFRQDYDSCLVVLALCIIAINVLVVYLFIKKDYLRTKTNCFLVSLAVSDLTTGLLSIPLFLVCAASNHPEVCLASAALYRCVAVSTMVHIMVVTLERYVAVMFPMRYYRMVTKRRVCFCIFLVWVFSIFYAVIQFSWVNLTNHNISDMGDSAKYEKPYNITGVVVCFAMPFLVIVFCFTRMFIVIRRQVKNIRRQAELAADPRSRSIASDKRALFIFATMLGVYTLCWLSWYITMFQVELGKNAILTETMADVLDFLRFGTSFFNPMLYTFLKNDFRHAVCSLFSACCIKSPIFTARRDSGVGRVTLTTEANGKASMTLFNALSPGPERAEPQDSKELEDSKGPENVQLISHV